MARDKLIGFAFMDIVDIQNDLRPRIVKLKSSGRGWVDLTRDIRAITLLGKGLGEIIKPSKDANSLCKNWKHVPTGKDYLVACTSTLKDISKWHGNLSSKPMELANGIFWHKPDKLFEPCGCKTSSCDRVQVLLPGSLGMKKHSQPFVGDHGAVIFGTSKRFPWHWPSEGNPIEGGSSDPEDDGESGFRDSGVGSSLLQSASSPPDSGSPSALSGASDATNMSTADGMSSDQKHRLASGSEPDITKGDKEAGQMIGTGTRDSSSVHQIFQGSKSVSYSSSRPLEEAAKGVATALRSRQPQRLLSAKRALEKAIGLDFIPQKRRKGKDPDHY